MPFILARIFREVWQPAFVQFDQAEQTDTVMVVKACELFLESMFQTKEFQLTQKLLKKKLFF